MWAIISVILKRATPLACQPFWPLMVIFRLKIKKRSKSGELTILLRPLSS
ncbi:hypothetical protein MGSAQ_000957 [marine sediment metagenome]|uniref:Uncharacterized protein n=1 Tax=marine sediment metagenome TaxID=412755 RepID=A0A1B6NW25_9ZZZZ